ncbi:hypothetical protein GF325_10405 [Candidatus Bathyarchaeota archaeon]|nr:hypothetical protein [Candidatus Bathyarchaeota archaeon]
MAVLYLANALGFSPMLVSSLNAIHEDLTGAGFTVLEPFAMSAQEGEKIHEIKSKEMLDAESLEQLRELNRQIGEKNRRAIDRADAVVAVLDGGAGVDSGVAAEIGYAFAREKVVVGLRGDFRNAGDNPGAIVNLQVEYFILESGGAILETIDRVIGFLSAMDGER